VGLSLSDFRYLGCNSLRQAQCRGTLALTNGKGGAATQECGENEELGAIREFGPCVAGGADWRQYSPAHVYSWMLVRRTPAHD